MRGGRECTPITRDGDCVKLGETGPGGRGRRERTPITRDGDCVKFGETGPERGRVYTHYYRR